jgi:hypothetical protein
MAFADALPGFHFLKHYLKTMKQIALWIASVLALTFSAQNAWSASDDLASPAASEVAFASNASLPAAQGITYTVGVYMSAYGGEQWDNGNVWERRGTPAG